ncbi:MAG TPA: GMC family oxidoreductase [Pyrinomonadaceae bacterium]|nr:GMC family oxidoreductase [Pyrinomonadaceae bacterium]
MAQTLYDVIVVGSGATGGMAAKELTEKGLRVLILEAGRKVDPEKEYNMLAWPYELKRRGFGDQRELERTQPIQSRCYACNEYSGKWFVNDLENPYTTPPDKPFFWIRSRQTGGRSLPWGRQSYRLSNYDFKAKTHDGYGDDWPISYEDLVPYYERVERFVGISGNYEKLPQLPDSIFQPPMGLTCGEIILRDSIAKMKEPLRRLTIGRVAILTKTIHQGTPDQRAACHFCGHCERGCDTASYYSSVSSTLPAAERTGRSTLVPHAVVSHVVLDKNTGRARGVHYVDGVTRQHREAYGKVVVLCAGTIETTRILLNSKSMDNSDGLANSSGVLGHYLMDHVGGGGARGTMPNLDAKTLEQDGRANGIYVPRFMNLTPPTKKKDFIRGYGYQGGAGQSLWQHAKTVPGFGAKIKESARGDHPWGISLGGFGESLARFENQVTLNKNVVDAWGIPVAHIDVAFGDNERKMVEDMGDEAGEMLERAGVKDVRISKGPTSTPGILIHEVGTARMGDDPKTSVLNKFNQAHDVKNLFVTDGACYVSIANQNPTLTMMAITTRACDYIAEQLRAGSL